MTSDKYIQKCIVLFDFARLNQKQTQKVSRKLQEKAKGYLILDGINQHTQKEGWLYVYHTCFIERSLSNKDQIYVIAITKDTLKPKAILSIEI